MQIVLFKSTFCLTLKMVSCDHRNSIVILWPIQGVINSYNLNKLDLSALV